MKKETQLQLVSFERAKRLKEADFDWKVKEYYTSSGMLLECKEEIDFNNSIKNILDGEWIAGKAVCKSAPTVALALKFILSKIDKERYEIEILYRHWTNSFELKINSCSFIFENLSEVLDELLTLIEK